MTQDKAQAPATEAPATEAPATEAPAKAKATRNRAASPFVAKFRVTVSIHKEADGIAQAVTGQELGDALAAFLNNGREGDATLSERVVAGRTRKAKEGAKTHSATQSVMVYAAPHAYEYSAMKETGVRLNAETWAQVQSAMTAAGIDPTADNFPAFMAALAKASAK